MISGQIKEVKQNSSKNMNNSSLWERILSSSGLVSRPEIQKWKGVRVRWSQKQISRKRMKALMSMNDSIIIKKNGRRMNGTQKIQRRMDKNSRGRDPSIWFARSRGAM
jgi:hypothetical protein